MPMLSYTIGCAFRAFPDSFSFSCHETAPTAKNKQGRETVSNYHDLQTSRNSKFIFKSWGPRRLVPADFTPGKKRSLPSRIQSLEAPTSLKNLLNAGIRSVLFLYTCEANPIAVRTSSSSSIILLLLLNLLLLLLLHRHAMAIARLKRRREGRIFQQDAYKRGFQCVSTCYPRKPSPRNVKRHLFAAFLPANSPPTPKSHLLSPSCAQQEKK